MAAAKLSLYTFIFFARSLARVAFTRANVCLAADDDDDDRESPPRLSLSLSLFYFWLFVCLFSFAEGFKQKVRVSCSKYKEIARGRVNVGDIR